MLAFLLQRTLDRTMHYALRENEEKKKKSLMEEIMSYFTRLQDCFHVGATSVVCIRNILQGVATYVVIA